MDQFYAATWSLFTLRLTSHQSDDLFADDALMDFPDDVEYAAPVIEVIGTAADQLGSAIIAKDQADGIDPYTIDEDGISRIPTRKMPLTEMIYAARFAALHMIFHRSMRTW